MKRVYLFIVMLFLFMPSFVNATDATSGRVTGVNVRVRDISSSNNSNIIDKLSYPTVINILSTTTPIDSDGAGCDKDWYKISYTNDNNEEIIGYMCSEYIKILPSMEFDVSKFPQSYQESLISLHEKYPSWIFVPIDVDIDFDEAVYQFSRNDKSLIYYTFDEGYRSTSSTSYNYKTDEFYYHPKEGSNWYYASSEIVAYYLDPRNFLDEKNIFMFENLEYNSSIHTIDSIERVLSTSFMTSNTLLEDGLTYKEKYEGYATWFISAAEKYSVNPVHLAARVKQEVGSGTVATSGNTFTYNYTSNGEAKTFTKSGLYNLFSIGAYGYNPPAIVGLVYANGGVDGSNTSYERPWTSPYKSILGGASVIDSGYISKGQNTLYFERFNVNPQTQNTLFAHSYMTNISAHVSESSTSYNAYKDASLLDEVLIFEIPIYNNMSEEKTPLPDKGNPNNYLKELSVNGNVIDNFDGDITTYEYIIPLHTDKVVVSASSVNDNAKISGVGEVILTEMEQEVIITVTSQNNKDREYIIKFIKDESSPISIDEILNNIGVKYNDKYITDISIGVLSDNIINNIKNVTLKANAYIKDKDGNIKTSSSLQTGDILVISSSSEYREYQIIVTGDNNSDGEITIVDLLRVQKYLLKYTDLKEEELLASDVNSDSLVTIVDLLRIQKYLLGYIDKL